MTSQFSQTIALLKSVPANKTGGSPLVCFLTGSSGSGKTYLCKEVSKRLEMKNVEVLHFDQIGVPSNDEMIEKYGSPAKWQEATTHEWVKRIAAKSDKALVLFEGQYDPQFLLDACVEHKLKNTVFAVVTCDESVWSARLRGPRQQADLVNDDMRNWSRLLREKTVALGGSVIDTSQSNVEMNLDDLAYLINPILKSKLSV